MNGNCLDSHSYLFPPLVNGNVCFWIIILRLTRYAFGRNTVLSVYTRTDWHKDAGLTLGTRVASTSGQLNVIFN